MNITIRPPYRAPAIGVAAAALVVGSFVLGAAQSGSAATGSAVSSAGHAVLTSSTGTGKITVTGTGTVTGVPSQLVLSMGVQASSSSVSTALSHANQAARRVIAALEKAGVAAADIQTADLSIQPNYHGRSQVPTGYGVSESLTATLNHLNRAGAQIQTAVTAGGNTVVVDDVSLNLTDTGSLLQKARAKAVRDAQAKATQFAQALHEPIDAVISVSDQTSQITYPEFKFAASAGTASPSVPVSPGTQQVSVQITVVYAIG